MGCVVRHPEDAVPGLRKRPYGGVRLHPGLSALYGKPHMRRKWIGVLLLAGVCAAAQTPPDIDATVHRSLREFRVPGAAVGILRDGKVAHLKGYGLRDVKRRLPVTPDTLFATGSISKSFTALLAASLVDEGKLEWDRPVREYLPWFRLHDPVATDLITVRDMLAHRSGLPRYDFLRWAVPLERAELVRRMRYLEPTVTFRGAFQYNNLMYVAAGYLEGVLAGSTWEQAVEDRIFTPLRMESSNTSVLESQKSPDHAKPHEVRAGEAQEVAFYNYQRFGVGPNGAVNATASDMLRYLQFHMSGGKVEGKQLVSAAQMRQMHSSQVVIGDLSTTGLGWNIEAWRGRKLVCHGGSIVGFTAWMGFLPADDFAVVVLTNGDTAMPETLGRELLENMLGSPPAPRTRRARAAALRAAPHPGTRPSHELMDFAGDYLHPAFGPMQVQVEAGNGSLRLVFPARTVGLKHYHYDVFSSAEGWLVQFTTDPAGEVAGVSVPLEPAAKPVVFTRRR